MKCGLIGAAAILVLLAISLEHVHAACPTGYQHFVSSKPDECFRIVYEDKDYFAAVEICDDDGAVIPKPGYKDALESTGFMSRIWIETPSTNSGRCKTYDNLVSKDIDTSHQCTEEFPFICVQPGTDPTPDPDPDPTTNPAVIGDDCWCYVKGDPMVTTCDGAAFMLVGEGNYTLVDITLDAGWFHLELQPDTQYMNTAMFYIWCLCIRTRWWGFYICSWGILVSDNRISINSTTVGYEQPGDELSPGYTVDWEDGYIVFRCEPLNIIIKYGCTDISCETMICLDAEYGGDTSGACGNFDGYEENDMMVEGEYVGNRTDRYILLSEKFREPNPP